MVYKRNGANSQWQRPIEAPLFDWSETPLAADYSGTYMKVLDDVFSPAECDALLALAESDQKWGQAAVSAGLKNRKYIDREYRNGDRILRFDHDAASKIYEKLLPYVQEVLEIKAGEEWETVIGLPGIPRGIWKLVGVNERLSFLKYGSGNYFREHYDAQLHLPDGRKSHLTLQIYLGEDGVEGGSTRISSLDGKRWVDVAPKKGRVIIFQQRNVWHSGEDVVKGTKYTLRSDFMFRQNGDGSSES